MALYYDIVPLKVPQSDESCWIGKVKTKSATTRELADLVLDQGCEYTRETFVTVFSHMERALRDLVCKGYTVTTDNATFSPVVKDSLTREGHWQTDEGGISCTVAASKAFKDKIAKVKAVYTGRRNTTGGACISLVEDTYTGSVNATLIPAFPMRVTGRKLKCVGQGGVGLGSVDILDASRGESVSTVGSLAMNTDSCVMFTCPYLAAGTYLVRITTHYTRGTPLTHARTLLSEPLCVA